MRILVNVMILALLICCKNSTSQEQANSKAILKITDKCAIIYNPDSTKICKAKSLNEDGFYVGADDAMFYIYEARKFLDSLKIKTINTEINFIDFYKNNQLIKHVDLTSDDHFWGIILFNGSDLPIDIDITNVEEEINKYWKDK